MRQRIYEQNYWHTIQDVGRMNLELDATGTALMSFLFFYFFICIVYEMVLYRKEYLIRKRTSTTLLLRGQDFTFRSLSLFAWINSNNLRLLLCALGAFPDPAVQTDSILFFVIVIKLARDTW